MFKVMRRGIANETIMSFNSFAEAKKFADHRGAMLGLNYDVVKVETVYTTQTIDEAIEGRQT